MSLSARIEYVRDKEKTLVVFNPPADSTLVTDLSEYFATQNVTVTGKQTRSGEPENVAVLRRNDEVLASVPIAKLEELLAGGGLRDTGVGIDDAQYNEVLQHLKETTFTSHSKSRMVTISHEIEDRAMRVNEGRLYTGFQYPEKLNEQADRYERLATTSLDVHTFTAPGEPVDIEGLTHHSEPADEIERSWIVVFDGGGNDAYKTGLLATEEAPDQWYGFWSDDPDLVDSIWGYLDTTYLKVQP